MASKREHLRKFGRLSRRIALGAFLFVLGIAALGILGTIIPYPPAWTASQDALRSKRILVISTSIHTDIAIPIESETLAAFSFLNGTGLPLLHPDARWLLFGWGGRSFYLETPTLADIKPGPALRAITIDSSVMHVDIIGAVPTDNPAILAIDLTDEAYAKLLLAIAGGFDRDDEAVKPIAGYAFGTTDRFYDAKGTFNVLLGCNIWTAHVLRAAGLTTGVWNPLPSSLTASIRLFNFNAVR